MSNYRDPDNPEVVPAAGTPGPAPRVVDPTVVQPTPVVAPPATEYVVPRTTAPTTVYEPGVVATDQVVRRSYSAFSASQVVHGVGAIILLIIGAIAVARGGFDGPASEQVGSVFGIEMTTPVGLAVIAAGLLLAIAALTPSGRPFGGFVGVLIAVGGIIIIAAHDDLDDDLMTDAALGWILIILGIVCVMAAFLPDELRTRRRAMTVGDQAGVSIRR